MRLEVLPAIVASTLVLAPSSAYAYIGPGAGFGAVATLLAIILGFVLLVVGFLWYPLKRALKKGRPDTTNKAKRSLESEEG